MAPAGARDRPDAAAGFAAKARQVLQPKIGTAHAAVIRYAIVLFGGLAAILITLQLLGIGVTHDNFDCFETRRGSRHSDRSKQRERKHHFPPHYADDVRSAVRIVTATSRPNPYK